MNFPRLLPSFWPALLALAVFAAPAARAQSPLGSVAAVFPYTPSKLLADPARSRVYAAVPSLNAVVVFDTPSLQVIATVPVGSDPVDLAFSPDSKTLYVANLGSASASAVDLGTLVTRASFALPGSPVSIAAGTNGRVYAALTLDGVNYSVQPFDGATGTLQAAFARNAYDELLQISPDGTRLFVASTGTGAAGGVLASYDLNPAIPVLLQTNAAVSSPNDGELVLSHRGAFLALPSTNGNSGNGVYDTFLFSAAPADNLARVRTFNTGAFPGLLAFSPDDSLAYQARSGSASLLDVFSTASSAKLGEVPLPPLGAPAVPAAVTSLAADGTNSYLFVAQVAADGTSAGQLAVLATGAGTLTPPRGVPAITSSLAVTGTLNQPFAYRITATNAPTLFTATGLPPGLTLDPAVGLISGTVSVAGSYPVTVTAANASGVGSGPVTLNFPYSFVPFVVTRNLPDTLAGQPFSAQVIATNAPTLYTATGLPTGLAIDPMTGLISGSTPAIPAVLGTYQVTLTAATAAGTGTATATLRVLPPLPAIPDTAPVTTTVNTPFTYQIVATNSPTSYTAAPLPAGLTLDPASGLISGTPTALTPPGQPAKVLLTAANTFNNAQNPPAAGTLLINVIPPAPAITNGVLTVNAVAGATFEYQVTATGLSVTYAAAGLPAGVAINPVTGLISGVPTVLGLSSATLTATDPYGSSGSAALTINVVSGPPVITSPATATVALGTPFSYRVTTTGAPTSYTAAGLPPGLAFDPVSRAIVGTPSVAGTFTITLTATSANGTGTGTLTLTVTQPAPVITSPTAATATAGAAFTFQITASNSPTSFAVAGSPASPQQVTLPPGLSVNLATGLISGTPTQAGTFPLAQSASNAGGTGLDRLTLTVNAIPASALTSPATASGVVGQPFAYQITASGSPTAFSATGLPAGLSFNAATGLISGVPVAAGTSTPTVGATNAGGSASQTLTLTVAATLPTVTLAATVPAVTAGTGAAGVFTVTLSAPQSADVLVGYTIRGTAVNGTDYALLSGTKKIRAGQTSRSIKVIPLRRLSSGSVKLKLSSASAYTVGTAAPVKVRIIAAP